MNKCALVSLMCAVLAGCLDEEGPSPDEAADDVIAVPKITSNALTPTQLWNSNLVSGVLNNTNLTAMAATFDGRAALHYAVVCALSSHQTVSVTVGGILYPYQGYLGLAGGWTTTALTATQQMRVTACVLSLVNLTGTPLNVSLRGGSLAYDPGETATYSVEEGAFWGNMFLGGSSWAAACNGVDQAARDVGTTLPLRECAEASGTPSVTPCGFNYAGLCTSACSSSGWYGGCNDGAHGTTSNVITTYVIP